ncbi:hypothetical protein DFH08DRAFT_822559 [Mycena albidolilacea]|uniref:Uncharacterized protein n=1 Tax=Mycena albidolilacea TaxID=1033008 RepID=A0AAD6Z8G3_9AGAR|nr:hypothetical protein DFH08DRAFT_822559 [Mycena albidolilacea]
MCWVIRKQVWTSSWSRSLATLVAEMDPRRAKVNSLNTLMVFWLYAVQCTDQEFEFKFLSALDLVGNFDLHPRIENFRSSVNNLDTDDSSAFRLEYTQMRSSATHHGPPEREFPPQGRDNSAIMRVGRAPACPLGQYPDYTTYPGYRLCTVCPAVSPDLNAFPKPATETAPRTARPGMRNPTTARAVSALNAPLEPIRIRGARRFAFHALGGGGGVAAPYNATINCNKAPSGWFQAFPGKPFKCGTCCGWEALANGNIVPTNCTTSAKPNAYKNSGSGCTADKTNCVHALTCAQNPTTGACPPNVATLTGIGLYTLGMGNE